MSWPRQSTQRRSTLVAACVLCVFLAHGLLFGQTRVHAQVELDPESAVISGYEASPDEQEAFAYAQAGRHIKARELAEAILKKKQSSFIAHLVIGYVNHYAEADFPRALFHLQRALALFEQRYGDSPDPTKPWRWHATLLRELGNAHGALEHYSERLAFIARFNLLYEPDMVADRAWTLMKLGRYQEARKAAESGLAIADRPTQRAMALNALCAIEFEAGNDGASYDACKHAVDDVRESGMEVSAVDLTNFAEASRSLFKLDEAERVNLEATEAELSWYGNPWMELAELYTRQGRFAEALGAIKRIGPYRAQRPPHVRDADRNETRRVSAAFLLVVGRADDAIAVTDRALVLPDRRSHNSRDPAQDRIVTALLDRRAKLVAAEQRQERALGDPWYERSLAWFKAEALRMQARSSGALVARLLRDEARMSGILRIGTAASAIMPPWLAGELVDVLGAGVVEEVITSVRPRDKRPGAGAYYDAFSTEVALAAGEPDKALKRAKLALARLGPSEVLLRARVMALASQAAQARDQHELALRYVEDAFQADPGVFRRLGLAVPVRITASGNEVSQEVADQLDDSPRLDDESWGLSVRVESDGTSGSACLVGQDGSALGCGRGVAQANDDSDTLASRIVQDFHDKVFAPRVDMTQADINSLDGTNLVKDDGLKTLFDQPAP